MSTESPIVSWPIPSAPLPVHLPLESSSSDALHIESMRNIRTSLDGSPETVSHTKPSDYFVPKHERDHRRRAREEEAAKAERESTIISETDRCSPCPTGPRPTNPRTTSLSPTSPRPTNPERQAPAPKLEQPSARPAKSTIVTKERTEASRRRFVLAVNALNGKSPTEPSDKRRVRSEGFEESTDEWVSIDE
ncbi:Uu.00g054480.m01.CDS01 [Anthostomella pinea]|uniref:Uu.00g054480.m01.CDS01 n=1 Tax=Anthostomella pinea TaxID=933095 RepID=A0AAI8VXV8_9PEZI|nr:Uu.00g054480.m01.CDS01 [Anthostomella pinea]